MAESTYEVAHSYTPDIMNGYNSLVEQQNRAMRSHSQVNAMFTTDALYPDRLESTRIKSGYYVNSNTLIKLIYPDLYNLVMKMENSKMQQQQQQRSTPSPELITPTNSYELVASDSEKPTIEEGSTFAVNEDNSWQTVAVAPSPFTEPCKETILQTSDPIEKEENTFEEEKPCAEPSNDMGWIKELGCHFQLNC